MIHPFPYIKTVSVFDQKSNTTYSNLSGFINLCHWSVVAVWAILAVSVTSLPTMFHRQISWEWMPLPGSSVITTSSGKDMGVMARTESCQMPWGKASLFIDLTKGEVEVGPSWINFISVDNSAVHLSSSVANNINESLCLLEPWIV